MIIIRNSAALSEYINSLKRENKKIGFVPTMGALHEGHLSLINTSKNEVDVTICSIFVNPAQFNDQRDYEKYPVTIDKDIEFLERAKTDLTFLPAVREIYPNGLDQLEQYELGYLENIMEGQYRPGHFQGVCQVMSRLLKLVMPNQLFMGQKDYQQCMVVQKLLDLMSLQKSISLRVCPTVRESDGLAMSSRNQRLNQEERKKAIVISQALKFVREKLKPGELTRLEIEACAMIAGNGLKVDYFEIARADTLELVGTSGGGA